MECAKNDEKMPSQSYALLQKVQISDKTSIHPLRAIRQIVVAELEGALVAVPAGWVRR